ncbi:MAG: 2TM domain-containing protein [Actinomycetota bacterium]|nr:2TM domain-containing protein [Actinomycetota bacterium]
MNEDAFDRSVTRHPSDARLGFNIHLGVYIAVNLFLVMVWVLTSDGFKTMPWFLFPLGGWGIGLVAHYIAIRPRSSGAVPRGRELHATPKD